MNYIVPQCENVHGVRNVVTIIIIKVVIAQRNLVKLMREGRRESYVTGEKTERMVFFYFFFF